MIFALIYFLWPTCALTAMARAHTDIKPTAVVWMNLIMNNLLWCYVYIYIYIWWKVQTQVIAWRLVLSMKPWSYIWLEFGLFSTIIAIIRACVCWALFVVTLTNTVHLIYIYIYFQASISVLWEWYPRVTAHEYFSCQIFWKGIWEEMVHLCYDRAIYNGCLA